MSTSGTMPNHGAAGLQTSDLAPADPCKLKGWLESLNTDASMTLEEVLASLDITRTEAEALMREARIPVDRPILARHDLVRVDLALERFYQKLAGRDWRRADGADREEFGPEAMGAYDLFHRKTGRRENLNTFGQLLRWAEAEYGWKS